MENFPRNSLSDVLWCPTNHFTILKLRNPSIGEFYWYAVLTRRLTVCEVTKIVKGSVGNALCVQHRIVKLKSVRSVRMRTIFA